MKKNHQLPVLLSLVLLMTGINANLFAQKVENSLFWEISGNGLEKPSYIFGTIHLLCENEIDVKPNVKEAFDASEILCLEIDLDDPGLPMKMAPLAMLPAGTTWENLMSKKEYEKVSQYFKDSLQTPVEMVRNMQPFFAFSMVYKKFLGCTPQGYDMAFLQMAKSAKKEVSGVEDVEEQLSAVKSMTPKQQAKMLFEAVTKGEKSKKQFSDLVKMYKEQNLSKIAELTKSTESGMDKKQTEAFLLKRNRNWIPVMKKMVSEKSVFFAVGAAHLAGDEGIVNLLRKEGFTVSAVEMK
jgi:uncharacterized protein YbaP (TraB family)